MKKLLIVIVLVAVAVAVWTAVADVGPAVASDRAEALRQKIEGMESGFYGKDHPTLIRAKRDLANEIALDALRENFTAKIEKEGSGIEKMLWAEIQRLRIRVAELEKE